MKLEVFTAEPPCAGCVHLIELADAIANDYSTKVDVIKNIGLCDEFDKYGLTVVPAVVVNEGRIKLMGMCPSRKTLESACKEMGI